MIHNVCSKNFEIIDDGSFLIDDRLLKDEVKCPSYKVCCRKKHLQVEAADQKCKNYETANTCGFRNSKGIGNRVKPKYPTGIKYSQYGEFPWSMALMNVTGKKPTLLSGGTLIHPKVVITAAHRITDMPDKSKILVRGGEFNTQVAFKALF